MFIAVLIQSSNLGVHTSRATKFFKVVLNICGSLVWNMIYVGNPPPPKNFELAYMCRENLCTPGLIVFADVFEIFLYNDYQRRCLGSWRISRHRIKYWGYLSWMQENREATKDTQQGGMCLCVSFNNNHIYAVARMSSRNAPLGFAAPFCPSIGLSAICLSTRKLVIWISWHSICRRSANVYWHTPIVVRIGKQWQTWRPSHVPACVSCYPICAGTKNILIKMTRNSLYTWFVFDRASSM